jgi:cytosine/creatinine deaminase
MLVLSRQRTESIIIGHDIEITVVDIRGDKVRLGIAAPRTVAVHRKEVYEMIKRENESAASGSAGDVAGKPVSADVAKQHQPFLQAAIDEAKKGLAAGGLPIGSVLVRNGEIIGRGHNQRVQKGDPMAHAEIDCLTNAGRQTTYKDTVLYSTLMPCFLCSGAAVQFGVPKVVVGESVNFHGGHGPGGESPAFMRSHGIEVLDLHDDECIAMMHDFIQNHPKLWNEDIGV